MELTRRSLGSSSLLTKDFHTVACLSLVSSEYKYFFLCFGGSISLAPGSQKHTEFPSRISGILTEGYSTKLRYFVIKDFCNLSLIACPVTGPLLRLPYSCFSAVSSHRSWIHEHGLLLLWQGPWGLPCKKLQSAL